MPKKLTPAARRHLIEVVQSPAFRTRCEQARMEKVLRANVKWFRKQTARMYGGRRWLDTLSIDEMPCVLSGCKERGIHGHSSIYRTRAERAAETLTANFEARVTRLRRAGLVRYEDEGSVFIGPGVDLEGKSESKLPILHLIRSASPPCKAFSVDRVTRAVGTPYEHEETTTVQYIALDFQQHHGVGGPEQLRILWNETRSGKKWLTEPMPAVQARQMAQQSREHRDPVRGLAVAVDFQLSFGADEVEPLRAEEFTTRETEEPEKALLEQDHQTEPMPEE